MSETDASADQTPEILAILRRLYPLETQLLGPVMTNNVVTGVEYRPLEEGRHIDLTSTIALIAFTTKLIQVALLAWRTFDSHRSQSVTRARTLSREQSTKQSVRDYLAQHPEANQILTDSTQVLDRLIEIIQQQDT